MELLGRLSELDRTYEDIDDLECSPVHAELSKRMKKTLYAGRADCDEISLPLTDIVVELFENADQGRMGQLSKRHVANVTRRAHVTQCSLFLSMMYTKRLQESNPDYVNRIKPAELFLVSMMIATKFLYDEGEEEELYNDEWAAAAKVDVNRVHDLEMEFLAAIDWKLLVDPLDFYDFLLGIETRIALSEGGKRGWYTYTDLSILMQHPGWYEACSTLIEHMVKVISICTLVYSVCAATTIWSALLLHHANIPLQPTNGCLPLPLGSHFAKSTETSQGFNHPLIDLVLHFYLTHDQRVAPDNSLRCSVPWYELEQQDLSRKGRLLQPSHERLQGVEEEASSCRCGLNQSSYPQSLEGTGRYCSCSMSWSRYTTTKMRTLQSTLVMFYHALLTAWSDPPSSTDDSTQDNPLSDSQHRPSSCSTCSRPEPLPVLNLTENALHSPHRACCQSIQRAESYRSTNYEKCNNSLKSSNLGSNRGCRGKRPIPSLISPVSDLTVGFRTSSEILVSM
ncbi:protein CNPPD1-like [Asterias amurensis]|uniref:protein CNPPD1-like n=1 Tax=Asterias amurensis TaxID=7602 RepID=UPI003AB441DB